MSEEVPCECGIARIRPGWPCPNPRCRAHRIERIQDFLGNVWVPKEYVGLTDRWWYWAKQ